MMPLNLSLTVLQKDFAALEAFYWFVNYVWCKRRCVIICSDVIVYSPHMRMFDLQLSFFRSHSSHVLHLKETQLSAGKWKQGKTPFLVFYELHLYLFRCSSWVALLWDLIIVSRVHLFSSSFNHLCIKCWCSWCFFNHVWWWSPWMCCLWNRSQWRQSWKKSLLFLTFAFSYFAFLPF